MINNQRWNDEQRQRLAELWNSGLSASDIARTGEFPGFSRNAIIGAVHRLRKKGVEVMGRGSPIKRKPPAPRKRRTNYMVRSKRHRTPPKVVPASPPITEGARLLEVTPDGCRFIIGDPPPFFLYCNAPGHFGDGRGPYCEYHRRIMRPGGHAASVSAASASEPKIVT